MVSNVEKLRDKCIEKLKNTSRLKLVWWSFRNNFNELQTGFPSLELTDKEVEDFIAVCDNRLDRAKTFLKEIAAVLGFDLVALTIVATIVKIEPKEYPISTFIGFLIVSLFFLFILLGHYRSHIHAWTAFKEKALVIEKCKKTA